MISIRPYTTGKLIYLGPTVFEHSAGANTRDAQETLEQQNDRIAQLQAQPDLDKRAITDGPEEMRTTGLDPSDCEPVSRDKTPEETSIQRR